MHEEKFDQIDEREELPDSWWYRVYVGVIVTTIVVIAGLKAFSSYFSS